MKDYVYIYNENGEKIKMEVILVFKIKELGDQYLLYKEENNNSEVYLAKVKPNTNELDTNITEEEKCMAKELLEKQLKESNNE